MQLERLDYDVIVIGGGMVGCSVAAHLSWSGRKVLVIERDQPGYHSTGRSAAVFAQTYGGPAVRALTRASKAFYQDPPEPFRAAPLLLPRGELHVAFKKDENATLDRFAALSDVGGLVERISPDQACRLCPVLKRELITGALFERETSDIDVNAVQQGFIKVLQSAGGVLWPDTKISSFEHAADGWRVTTDKALVSAALLVNAAGAWAGEVARELGARTPSFQPLRRTAVLVDAPAGASISAWPLVIDAAERFYFKPDAGAILVSPADETPSPPTDAQADELDVAIAIDRLQSVTNIAVQRVRHKWAGLRTFVPDRAPVIGFADDVGHYFWAAALGGYGIQTAPAVGALAASLIEDKGVPAHLAASGFTFDAVSPARAGAF